MHEHAHRVPGGLHPRPAHEDGQPRGVRVGGRRALGRLPAVQGMQAVDGRLTEAVPVADRLARLTWEDLERSLWDWGWARTPPLLTPAECDALTALYDDDHCFRSRVDMARYRFGVGEY